MGQRWALIGIVVVTLLGCAPRPNLVLVQDLTHSPQAIKTLWVAKLRQDVSEGAAFGLERPKEMRYERHKVTIPPEYEVGAGSLPRERPNARRHMLTQAIDRLGSLRALARELAANDKEGTREALIYVHGYNTNHAEAVYGLAQMLHAYEIPVPAVLFSWPSAAQTRGYVYDRDSVALSRNHLETLIEALAAERRRVVVVGHSMGSLLIMETLRQMELKAPGSVDAKVDAVMLLAPDIDPEVFREQIGVLRRVPQPFLVMTSEKDGALRLSGLLTGRGARLGTLTDPKAIQDLPITVIDLTDLADGSRFNHQTFATSPLAVAMIQSIFPEGRIGEARFDPFIDLGARRQ